MILFSCFAGILLLISKTNGALLDDYIDNEVEEEDTHSAVNDAIVEEVPQSRTLKSFIKRASNENLKSENQCSSISKRYIKLLILIKIVKYRID